MKAGDHGTVEVFHLVVPFFEGLTVGGSGVPDVTFDFLEETTAAGVDLEDWLVA